MIPTAAQNPSLFFALLAKKSSTKIFSIGENDSVLNRIKKYYTHIISVSRWRWHWFDKIYRTLDRKSVTYKYDKRAIAMLYRPREIQLFFMFSAIISYVHFIMADRSLFNRTLCLNGVFVRNERATASHQIVVLVGVYIVFYCYYHMLYPSEREAMPRIRVNWRKLWFSAKIFPI